jgi:hypothetical protein
MSLKFSWKGQEFTRISGPSGPVNKRPILFEFCNFPEPLRPALVRNGDYVREIARPQQPLIVSCTLFSNPLARHSFLSQSTGTGGLPFSVFPQQHP